MTRQCVSAWFRLLDSRKRLPSGWDDNKSHNGRPNRILLKTVNGHSVCTENGDGSLVVARHDAIGPWEIFALRLPALDTIGAP